jgi:DNA-binding HxlR family transcriptional regulator
VTSDSAVAAGSAGRLVGMAADEPPAPTDDLDAAVRRIGDRWTLLVVDALRAGPRRYGELEADLAGIAPTVLARRLRDLEADGLVTAAPYQDRPVRMAYELTAAGAELAGALDLLRQWGASQRGAGGSGLHHDACGTDLVVRLWCGTCEQVVDDGHASDLHHF